MLIYNIYKCLYYTVGLVIIEGGGMILKIMSRSLRITLTTPRSSQLSPRKHDASNQCWYNAGPTLKTVYQDYYRFNISCYSWDDRSVFAYYLHYIVLIA